MILDLLVWTTMDNSVQNVLILEMLLYVDDVVLLVRKLLAEITGCFKTRVRSMGIIYQIQKSKIC